MLGKPKNKSHTKVAPDAGVVVGRKDIDFNFETMWIQNLKDSDNGV
jgi:hypothetical protein